MTQELALAILKTGANVFLTGEPGSGKTHTVNRYVRYLREHKIEHAITASTGIAATHIGGVTIHSWSGIGIRKTLSRDELRELARRERLADRIERTRVLIIDEISMLAAGTLSLVDAVCRKVKRIDQAFGGMQVVFVGDFFQLPPVSADGERAEFAFLSEAWAAAKPVVCYLSEQHRQNDQTFLRVLSALRASNISDDFYDILSARRVEPPAGEYMTRLYSHNVDVDRLNLEKLQGLSGEPASFRMTDRGAKPLVEQLKKGCLSPEELVLKKGARVMFTKNNFEFGFVNGTIGAVAGLHDDGFPLVKVKSGRVIHATPMDWSIMDGERVVAKIVQVPLRLAWAITVHKSQGMTMDAAVMDLSAAFEFGQGYVALSRVRALSGLFLLGYNRRSLEVHPDIVRQDQHFKEISQVAKKAREGVSPVEMTKLHRQFVISSGGRFPGKQTQPVKAGGFVEIRKRHPNAYQKWTAEEEKQLKELFDLGVKIKEIAKHLGRKPGGIRSRLKKLELIED